jgi:AraC-like DNA-binding protein
VFNRQLDDYATAMNGGTGSETLRLPNRLRLDRLAGQAFQRYLTFLWSEIQRDSPLLSSDLLVQEWEKALLGALLLAADPREQGAEKTLPPAYLRRAVDFIMAHLAEPLSLGRVAAAAGVNARTLQGAVQREHGTSVMALVRERRLERTNAQLLAADPAATSVTEIALNNGFSHLSRFSAAYRRRFGEYPSETLRRA